jgi:glycosyltransferase involved in cell wall biosynthesis
MNQLHEVAKRVEDKGGICPDVSFVIPCYKLGHLLTECVNSILIQSFANFEILIMDDCSPDNTSEVSQSFNDSRVRHIRNEQNLGHLRNYNKGINLSRGRFVWLISADDYLRKPYVLERYVELMDANPQVGFVFCGGMRVQNGNETEPLSTTVHGDQDRILNGHEFLKTLMNWNSVLAASGMVRRECYEKITIFPVNMPWAGDWYLWLVFALHFDVGYLAEPMVCYRGHEMSMTTKLTREKLDSCADEDISIPWLIREQVIELGYFELAKECLPGIAHTYTRILASKLYSTSSWHMNFEKFERQLMEKINDESVRSWIRANVFAGVGSECYWKNDLGNAYKFYRKAISINRWMFSIWVKLLLLSLGKCGGHVRKLIKIGSSN